MQLGAKSCHRISKFYGVAAANEVRVSQRGCQFFNFAGGILGRAVVIRKSTDKRILTFFFPSRLQSVIQLAFSFLENSSFPHETFACGEHAYLALPTDVLSLRHFCC
jgi:hypothetical protein